MQEPMVTNITEQTRFGRLGKPEHMIHIEFMVGDHGPFSMDFPKQGFNAREALQKVIDFAHSLEPLTGR